MIETAEDFLRHMKGEEHQALFVAHDDKAYAHVHVMLNAIHPETGLRLNEDFERRRAQQWALAYEREQELIHCQERLKDAEERERYMPRPAWMAFRENQRDFDRAENALQENTPDDEDDKNNPRANDWKRLKDIQRRERDSLFAEGRLTFSELRRDIYREVREEFRERWADLYGQREMAPEASPSDFQDEKLALIEEQKRRLDERRKETFEELRASRDIDYRALLDDQRDIRHGMRARQDAGLDNSLFLDLIDDRDRQKPVLDLFRDTASETTRQEEPVQDDSLSPWVMPGREDNGNVRSPGDVGASVATGLGFALLDILGGIADGLTGSKPPPKPTRRITPREGPSPSDSAAEDARRQQVQREIFEADEEYYRKQERSRGE